MHLLRIRSLVPGIAARAALSALLLSQGACSDHGSPEQNAPARPVAAAQPPPPPVPLDLGNAVVETRPAFEPPAAPPIGQLSCAPCKKIAFTSARDGNEEIYSVDADGTGLRRLTNDSAHDDLASWSPDGTRILFIRGKYSDGELVVMNADGSNATRLALPHGGPTFPRWSADGTRITYAAVSDGSQDLWTVDADGGSPVLLFSAPGWDAQPSWSPDGTELVLVSDWLAYDFVLDVFRIDSHGSGFTLLTDGNIFDRLDYQWPSWSPDGTKIATTMIQEIKFDRGARTYLTYVGVMGRDGKGLKPLVAAADESKSSWSPDGTVIAFTSGKAGAYDVSWVKADGSAMGTIITDGWNPDWQR